MPAPIDPSIKKKVIQQWLSGEARAKIAIDNNIGEGTISGIVNEFKIGLDTAEFDSARELALAAKKQGLNLSDLASNFRLHNFIKKSGANEDEIESFIVNVSNSNLPPEEAVEYVNQLYAISKNNLIPLDQVSGYIKEKLEQKQKIDEDIIEADSMLQSKNVSIEAINEHTKLNEKLNEYNLSFQDVDKLLNVLVNAKEYGFDGIKIVGKLRKIKRLERKEEGLKNNCTILAKLLEEYKEIVPLAKKIKAMNIDIQQLLVFHATVKQIARQYNIPPYIAALRLFNDITYYNKIGGLKKEVSRLSQQVFVVNGVWANQNKAIMAMINLQSRGITEDRILYLNNFLENNAFKASSYTSTK